ncbi:MAG TPA: glycerophosphodiester phosphodiesterase [Burkholderiales bacterium]|nr:glycerophosphodiester phosphodiesterase [Burkholderiales bacterium]
MRFTAVRFVFFACLLVVAAPVPAFDLQGHRGARGLAPENTLPAFAQALSIGVSTLELDVGVTRDGVVVVAHDRRLNPELTRDANGKWLEAPGPAIHALTYAELARYDVGRAKPGSRTARRYPQQQPADGARIPRLAEVFALAARASNAAVRFNVETKLDPERADETLPPEPFARAVIGEIRKAGVATRSTLQSFDWRTLQVVQREAPEIATVYLSARQNWLDNIRADATLGSPWTAGIRFAQHGSVPHMVQAAGGRIWSPYHGDLDAAQLAAARALGLRVIVWTVNDPARIAALLDLGVDGIISDYPDRVRAELQRRGLPLPPATPDAGRR